MPPRPELEYRNAKPKNDPYKLFDGGGLHLVVHPHGSKLWRMAYRFNRRAKLLSFGPYPAVSLRDARELRDKAKKVLAEGKDPSEVKRSAPSKTFKAVAEACLAKWNAEKAAEATLVKKRWLLDFVIADLGNREIDSIGATELLKILRKIEKKEQYETASRVRSTAGQVFRFAIASGLAERDISVDLRGALIAPKPKHHSAITEPKKIGSLLRAIDGFDGYPTTQIALKLAPLLFVRPGELRMAEWAEINLQERQFRIPANKMKMRRDHIVPLSDQALRLLKELKAYSGESKFLFPSTRTSDRSMSENTLNAALRRLGYTPDEMTIHGFRTTASTRLNESGKFSPDAIERQLAHQEPNEVRRAYNAAELLPERRKMMQFWADYLDQLRTAHP